MKTRILVITEKLDKNDESAGFFHGRLADFATKCDKLIVLVLENKSHNLPAGVKILSLGKEKGLSKLFYVLNFYKYIFSHLFEYDRVFIHRNPLYIVLGGIFWRLSGKEITLWYSHAYSDWTLRLAVMLANKVISPSRNSFPFKTKKLKVLNGQDLESYAAYIRTTK